FDDVRPREERGVSRPRPTVAVSSYVWGGGDDEEEAEEEEVAPDPVGEAIARMLNEGKVPHFGYRPRSPPADSADSEDEFRWFPLLTARNFRALRRRIVRAARRRRRDVGLPRSPASSPGKLSNNFEERQQLDETGGGRDGERDGDGRATTVRFLLESFAVGYVALCAANDLLLRWSGAAAVALLGALLAALFDADEIERLRRWLGARAPTSCFRSWDGTRTTARESFAAVERELLWGRRFSGRTFLWSDEGRLTKFRRKHRRVLATNGALKHGRREVKKRRAERRRRHRRGEAFAAEEAEQFEEEVAAHERLEASAERLKRKPPTFFPERIASVGGDDDDDEEVAADGSRPSSPVARFRADATDRHLDSLRYCHAMIFFGQHRRRELSARQVEIKATSNDKDRRLSSKASTWSPREFIEVVDQFPDIGSEDVNLSPGRSASERSFASCGFSPSSPRPSPRRRRDHRRDSAADYSSDEDDDRGDETDGASVGSHESESTATSLPWAVVGVKIGRKLLNAPKLRRVLANPEAMSRNLLPDEAKKLMGGMNDDEDAAASSSTKKGLPPSSSKSPSATSGTTSSTDDNGGLRPPSMPEAEMEMDIKPPVHGMWTSAGSAANGNAHSYGAVTLANSPPRTASGSKRGTTEPSGGGDGASFAPSLTPKRWRLRGSRAPPPSPQIESHPTHSSWTSLASGESSADAVPAGFKSPYPLIRNMPTPPRSPPSTAAANAASPPRDVASAQPPQPSQSVLQSPDDRQRGGRPTHYSPAVTRLAPIEKGVKMVVPLFPPNGGTDAAAASGACFYQMGTVMSSRRLYVPPNDAAERSRKRKTNCLSVSVILDKALLRGSKFVEMTIRIMDEWNYVPRHSKFPIGSCVATTFGAGILVGWRVEDDMHIIRSLWNRKGFSGLAYLRRDSVHTVLEAAVGFDVQTTYGSGKVLGYVQGGERNITGKYVVQLNARHKGRVMEFNRCQILSCQGAKFVPVTEHIRAAALYRLEVLHYKAKLRERILNSPHKGVRQKGMWRNFSEYVDLFANSFSKAIAEDPDFDQEVDKFVSHIINLLDGDKGGGSGGDDEGFPIESKPSDENGMCPSLPSMKAKGDETTEAADAAAATVGWNVNDVFGWFFVDCKKPDQKSVSDRDVLLHTKAFEEAHESVEILIRVLLRTITAARASVPDRPKLHIALAMMHEALLFVRQILRVQNKHTSRKLIEAWFQALSELSTTFGPLKQRMAALGVQIAKKFKKHGNVVKRRILRFVDIFLGDTQLLHALELGDWKRTLLRVEIAIVKANITDAATCEQLHKGVTMMYKNLAPRKRDRKTKAAASRNGQKMVNFAKIMKIIASPGRSVMRLLTRDEVLSLFDRVLVRVFDKDPLCSTMINIYAFNFDSIRHLRTLNNMSIAGKLWETVLDAIDEELTFATSEIPEQTKYFIEPLVKLFSLGVSQFHFIQSGGSTADWLDFLMEDEAVEIIQDLDMKFIDSLENLCSDIKQVVQVLPYIKTIDNDILNLMDEFNFDAFLKEITDVLGDAEKTVAYITERSSVLVERFLDYLPRMSIPIERRELQDGWVLTCRSKDGGDLRLSDLSVLRENLHLSVMGSANVFQPLSGKDYIGSPRHKSPPSCGSDLTDDEEEDCVLDEIKELIVSAQSHGAWIAGVGGLKESYQYSGVPYQLTGLPMSDRLKTNIDLWQTSAISDFELLETAIREVSYQIQLQKEREEKGIPLPPQANRFNPRADPTVLFLDIKNLTLRLEEFGFRVEKGQPLTIFDPVFEGCGSITVKNVSITLKVEVKKERVFRGGLETSRPVFLLSSLNVELERLRLEFQETGADWILNAVLKGFSQQITDIVQDNLKQQIVKQVHTALEIANEQVAANPDLLLNIL
ncbi:hypothetical protein ACHAWF_013694, partial [Thalassiosira exigua]